MQQRDEGTGHETAATSRNREGIHRSPRTEFRTGSSGADSRIFDYTTEFEHLGTVEMSAPAEEEEVVR
jgi:hypothetical protein